MRILKMFLLITALLFMGCSSGTQAMVWCGDGVLDLGEECDDGNKIDGDGCDKRCLIEPGAVWSHGQHSNLDADLDFDNETDESDFGTSNVDSDSDSDVDTDADSDSDDIDALPNCSVPYVCLSDYQCKNSGGTEITSQECDNLNDVCCYILDSSEDDEPCENDSYEPNNHAVDAFSIDAPAEIEGEICPEDHDFFSIELSQNDHIMINLEFLDYLGDLDLFLYKSDSAAVAFSESISDNESISYFVESSGVYFIEIYGWLEESNLYFMEVLVEEAGDPDEPVDTDTDTDTDTVTEVPPVEWTCPTDDEFEENDSTDEAYLLESQTDLEAIVCSDDPDFYALDLNEGDVVNVSLLFRNSEGDLDIIAFSPSGSDLDRGETITDDESIQFTATTNGVYHLYIYGWDSAENLYQLSIDVDKADTEVEIATDTEVELTCPEDDSYEPNDSVMESSDVRVPFDLRGIICSENRDFYRFRLEPGETIDVSLLFSHADGDLDILLLDTNGNMIVGSQSMDDDENLTFTSEESALFSLEIYGFQESENSYELDVVRTNIDDTETPTDTALICPIDDSFELNDSQETATEINGSFYADAILCAGDVDWYSVDLSSGDQIEINIYFEHDLGNIELAYISPDSGMTVMSESTSDNEQIISAVPASGTYWFLVYGSTGTSENNYTLDVEVREDYWDAGLL